MENLINIPDETPLRSGAIFRLFGVKRLDVMKSANDFWDNEKKQRDFYDYLLVNANVIAKGSFLLVNATLDNHNRGEVFAVFSNTQSEDWINAKVIKEYFEGSDVYQINDY
jgi:hypothetical protein